MLLVVVYVGAVAVLFLFVVMMLDIDFAELRAGLRCNYLPLGALVGLILVAELVLAWRRLGRRAGGAWRRCARATPRRRHQHRGARAHALHRLCLLFQTAGLVLLVAMIGAIVLTLRHRPGVRRQDDRATRSRRTPR